MAPKSTGKVLTLFLVIIAVLLISLTAVTIFFLNKEIEKRTDAENTAIIGQKEVVQLQEDLKKAGKQTFLLEEKNKEADERINSLLDEIELEQGLREEIKKKAQGLQKEIELEVKTREQLRERLSKELDQHKIEIKELKSKLQDVVSSNQQGAGKMESESVKVTADFTEENKNLGPEGSPASDLKVELDPIVVNPGLDPMAVSKADVLHPPANVPEGRIMSVDAETEFVIINLGNKNGIKMNMILSVYRGDNYLGDVKVTRVQSEMSAADLIPPFSSRMVRQNDQVIAQHE